MYQEFDNYDINQLSLGALDYSSLAARNVMKTLTLQALSSEAGDVNRQVDTDGEGLPDELDNDFSNKTNKYLADSDDDGFSDAFEVRRHDEGFRANQKDGRGAIPVHR